jgi:hypothetical protein
LLSPDVRAWIKPRHADETMARLDGAALVAQGAPWNLTHYPLLVFAAAFVALWFPSASCSTSIRTILGECGSTSGPVSCRLISGAVRGPATAPPTPVGARALAGMNDVINSQGYTQAAFWNRIPTAAWCLMVAIALCSNVLFGYRSRNGSAVGKLALVLPRVVSTAFLLIADIDAPRHGLIEVRPQNLESLAKSLGR